MWNLGILKIESIHATLKTQLNSMLITIGETDAPIPRIEPVDALVIPHKKYGNPTSESRIIP